MRITYIGHSGFLAEFSHCCCLFDYYQGEIPATDEDKPLFVFVSHRHQDHFNPKIFHITGPKEIHYILSSDTRRYMRDHMDLSGLHFMKAEESLTLTWNGATCSMTVKTLHSTDCGVAFLIHTEDKNIYHAGDLNWWVWPGESKQYNNNMTANFKKYTEPLKGLELFAAFLPLDPRQEEWYDKGFSYILENTRTRYAFPMHFWKDFSVIPKYLSTPTGKAYKNEIMILEKEGQIMNCPEDKEDK